MLKILKKQAVALVKEGEAAAAEMDKDRNGGMSFDMRAYDKGRTYLASKLKNGSLFVAKRQRDKDTTAFNDEISEVAGSIWNGHVHLIKFYNGHGPLQQRELRDLLMPYKPWTENQRETA